MSFPPIKPVIYEDADTLMDRWQGIFVLGRQQEINPLWLRCICASKFHINRREHGMVFLYAKTNSVWCGQIQYWKVFMWPLLTPFGGNEYGIKFNRSHV